MDPTRPPYYPPTAAAAAAAAAVSARGGAPPSPPPPSQYSNAGGAGRTGGGGSGSGGGRQFRGRGKSKTSGAGGGRGTTTTTTSLSVLARGGGGGGGRGRSLAGGGGGGGGGSAHYRGGGGGGGGRNPARGGRNSSRGGGGRVALAARQGRQREGGGGRTSLASAATATATFSSGRGGRGATPPVVLKKNGEKGAEAFTVAEEDKIRFTQWLERLREEDPQERLELPPTLTNTERKFIHQLATQLGLASKSTGRGEERRITVYKPQEKQRNLPNAKVPTLIVGASGEEALRRYLQAFPPTEEENLAWASLTAEPKDPANDTDKDDDDDDDDDDDEEEDEEDRDKMESVHHNDHEEYDKSETGSRPPDEALSLPVTPPPSSLSLSSSSKLPQRLDHGRTASLPKNARRTEHYWRAQRAKESHGEFAQRLAARCALPAFAYRQEICRAVQSHAVTLLVGETGCGKSTQVPQYLLDDATIGPTACIAVTQPRRISAISIAERVAHERTETVGHLVGYNVRLDTAVSAHTQVVFMTPGVLLRQLQSGGGWSKYTHIILDEVHERDKYCDFLMICLQDLLRSGSRPDLRILLMSATMSTAPLVEYWSRYHNNTTPVAEIHIPGRTFAVAEYFLEDVLSLTGFVDPQFDLQQLDKALDDYLQKKQAAGHKKKKSTTMTTTTTMTMTTTTRQQKGTAGLLVCCLCQRGGFRTPEELGSHVGLCDGGGNSDTCLIRLEEEIRQMDAPVPATTSMEAMELPPELAAAEAEAAPTTDPVPLEDDVSSLLPPPEVWDVSSLSSEQASRRVTLTEEELLNRYQATHNDEIVDLDLLVALVQYIVSSPDGGAILIFFPGWQEISNAKVLLDAVLQPSNCFWILPLHSGVASREQRWVFQTPPQGVRKIVLATNIAETSVTINDVTFVVDTGRAKEKSYDPHLKTSTLQPVWESKASAKQRSGRAGRTKPGVCYRLFSRRRFASFRPFVESELLRTPLEELCLMCQLLQLAPDGIASFLAQALDPPHPKSVTNALELLQNLGAFTPNAEELTPLGHALATLSVEPQVGKMVLWSFLLKCPIAAMSMAVALSYKSPFVLPPPSMKRRAQEVRLQWSQGSESDVVLVLHLWKKRNNGFSNKAFGDYCQRNFISASTMQMMQDLRHLLQRELQSCGFFPAVAKMPQEEQQQQGLAIWQAALCAGLYPNVAVRFCGDLNYTTLSNQKAKVFGGSINHDAAAVKCQREVEFLVFGQVVRSVSFLVMHETTRLQSPLALVLLCGNTLDIVRFRRQGPNDGNGGGGQVCLTLDDWIVWNCPNEKVAFGLYLLRQRLATLFQVWLQQKQLPLLSCNDDLLDCLNAVLQSGHDVAAAAAGAAGAAGATKTRTTTTRTTTT